MGGICPKKQYKKKNLSSSGFNYQVKKKFPYSAEEKLTIRPLAEIKLNPANQKSLFRKDAISLTFPKIDVDIEKNKLRRIKNGKINIDGTIDLHGFSLKEAEVRLRHFVGESFQLRKRFLLIITGKGLNSKTNIHG